MSLYCILHSQYSPNSSIPPTCSFKNIPLGFGLLLLPFFEEFEHHHFGGVTLVQRPKVFGLQRHFVAFHGHTEREKQQFNLNFYIRNFDSNNGITVYGQIRHNINGWQPPPVSLLFESLSFLSVLLCFLLSVSFTGQNLIIKTKIPAHGGHSVRMLSTNYVN